MSARDSLEERVRETLARRAAGVAATPALWDRVVREARRRRRRWSVTVVGLVAAAVVIVAVATTLGRLPVPEIDVAPPDEDAAPTGGAGGAGAAGPSTWTVAVDGELEDANVTINGFLPTDLSVRPGDTVEFAVQPGDAHTVTFGTLIDSALAAGPGGPDGPSPEFEALPDALTVDGDPVATGLAPCYSDDPPQDGSACDQQEQPVLRGDLTLHNSGALQPGSTHTVQIADDIEPGDYGYLCLIHGFPMTGTLTVVDPTEDLPSPDEVLEGQDATLQALTSSMQDPLTTLQDGDVDPFYDDNGVFTDGDDATVVASGFGGPRAYYIEILQFGPADVQIQAGQTVRWHFQTGGHTISFNPTPDATPAIVPDDDGLPTINQQAVTTQGGATPIPPFAELDPDPQPGPPPPATVIDGGEWNGQGPFSTGLAPDFPPVSYDITFTQPGTYDYRCLIHPT